ncbi:MAG: pyrroline-5-carboxylate reductase [Clostridia bacterium]
MNLGFIGTGNMASALIEGFKFKPENVYVSNKTPEKAKAIAERLSVKYCETNEEVCKNANLIFICVKPNKYEEVLTEIKPFIKHKTIVSIAAGITIEFIKKVTDNNCKIVRTMPNTPAQVMCGTTGMCFCEKVSGAEQLLVMELFKRVGQAVRVQEKDMHAVVALSGSSPAYAYMFIEAMAKAGEKIGFNYEDAVTLAANSVMGAAKMVLETGISPEQLTKNVCSPGGTTIEGVAVLEKDIDSLMFNTVKAVADKSVLLTK